MWWDSLAGHRRLMRWESANKRPEAWDMANQRPARWHPLMRVRAIVIIVICLVISHKVTPLNNSSLAFFVVSGFMHYNGFQWKQWQRQGNGHFQKRSKFSSSSTLLIHASPRGVGKILVISEIYWGLFLQLFPADWSVSESLNPVNCEI